MNPLLKQVIANKGGHYCHVAEVSSVYELQCIAEGICNEFKDEFSIEIIEDFLSSLTIYVIEDEDEEGNSIEVPSEVEEAIYDFNFAEYINQLTF